MYCLQEIAIPTLVHIVLAGLDISCTVHAELHAKEYQTDRLGAVGLARFVQTVESVSLWIVYSCYLDCF